MTDPPVTLITGTSRGIGNHLAQRFLALGHRVVGCSRSAYDGIDHPAYRHEVVDVASEPQVVELFRTLRRDYGRLDIAVNNAVSDPALAPVATTSSAAATRAFATDVIGPLVVCREATRMMLRQERGRIVNIGSMATAHPIEGGAVYTAAKAAVEALTVVLAREVAAHGITCNVVAPASAQTDLLEALTPERVRETLSHNAVKELGSAEDVAALVEWLASPAADAVTGQVIYLGGA